ncbi:uncharacterized protein LOC127130802 [Lathyrus oleraceus]|uniref:uncharacterized protein LOC127130802 n=1 Tax=Pisum sativum TaxID=3888 RepID=UPI0021D2316E|nr:uncharacterized protein LOC127130802 [Pisum sativum]
MDQMLVYAKFMKELLSRKRHLRDDKNIILDEECISIIQRKLPPKLTDPSRFTIPCLIGPVKVDQTPCDFGASTNRIPVSMVKRLGCGYPKSTHITLTLADSSITYPYGTLEDVLVKGDDLVFLVDFVILDMPEDTETPLILGRPFLEIGRSLIYVELGELALRFNREQMVFYVFEATKHPQCYNVSKLLKSLKKRKPTKEELKVGKRV